MGLPTNPRLFANVGAFEPERGGVLDDVTVAYQTWGTLNSDCSNAVLVCHAISGDSNAAAWWSRLVGPGKALDTDKYFVLCSNVLGGCQGSTGPQDGSFPFITVGDMVRVQSLLISPLGIERLALVCGGSMGGMQALEWARAFPDRVARVWATASAPAHSAMQIGFNEVARQAIMRDPKWRGGEYGDDPPVDGLAVARMLGHLTYLSEEAFSAKFGRRLQEGDILVGPYQAEFANKPVYQVENYLGHQGEKFVQRFDANTFIVVSNAIDSYSCSDLPQSDTRFLFTSFTSDFLYPSHQSREGHELALGSAHESKWVDIPSPLGHDAFLLDDAVQAATVREFLDE